MARYRDFSDELDEIKDDIIKSYNRNEELGSYHIFTSHLSKNGKQWLEQIGMDRGIDSRDAKEQIIKLFDEAKTKESKLLEKVKDLKAIFKEKDDTHAKPNTETTKETSYTEANHTEKETNTDDKHEATQRENRLNTERIDTRTSDSPQENKDRESLTERDNGISNEYAPSTKEMAQEWNEKANEKRDVRDDTSNSLSEFETNANTSRDTQGHNAGIRFNETNNERYKHDGDDSGTSSRARIHRNVSLKKKGKEDSNNTESKVPTHDTNNRITFENLIEDNNKESTFLKEHAQSTQTTKEIIKEAKENGLSVKETKEVIEKNKEIESNSINPQTTEANAIKTESKVPTPQSTPKETPKTLQEVKNILQETQSKLKEERKANEANFYAKAKVKPTLDALKEEWLALEPTILTWKRPSPIYFGNAIIDYDERKMLQRKPNLSNLYHIEDTLEVYKGYATDNPSEAKTVEREMPYLKNMQKN